MRLIDRVQEIPAEGPFADLMWSDPTYNLAWSRSPRGAGWLFGAKPTNEFNHINGTELVARAHQLVMEGFQYWFEPENSLITVWSAPNYCYRCGNIASIMSFDEKLERSFSMFEASKDLSKAVPLRQVVPYFL